MIVELTFLKDIKDVVLNPFAHSVKIKRLKSCSKCDRTETEYSALYWGPLAGNTQPPSNRFILL